MAEVVWTRGAAVDLETIRAYIGQFSPLAAQRVAMRLVAAARSLEHYPERGRSISRGRRELTIVWPYLVRYRVDGARVLVLEIRHGAREPD